MAIRSSRRFSAVNHNWLSVILLMPLVVACGAQAEEKIGAPVSGVRINFPDDPKLPWDKFGVFIGISRYAGLPANYQLDAPVHDAQAFKAIFTTGGTFEIKRYAMLTDGQATRENIGQVLRALVEQVKAARQQTQKTITVVITYAGHGSRVTRRAEDLKEHPDLSQDEGTWVCADARGNGPESGDKDLRASELFKVHAALSRLGAQVIMISDACHSGSGFRGQGKVRAVLRDHPTAGPKEDLFPALSSEPAANPAAQASALPGFVWYAACADGQSAYEGASRDGLSRGYFSGEMCQQLGNISRQMTYGELASRLQARFAIAHPLQSPEFHSAAAKDNERFFSGGFAPPHATIIGGPTDDHLRELSMGSIHGVSSNSKFVIYRNSADFESSSNALAQVDVVDVAPLSCHVREPAGLTLPSDCWAALDCVRINDVVVGVDGDVPPLLLDKLKELDRNQQITLAPLAASQVALHYDSATQLVGIYDVSALPPLEHQHTAMPHPLRPLIQFSGKEDAEIVASNLLYVLRVRRLMELDHVTSSQYLKMEILCHPAKGPAAAAPRVNGIPRLAAGDLFTLHITNTAPSGGSGLYVTIFGMTADGDLSILYPEQKDIPEKITPGRTIEFPPASTPMRATLDHPENLSGAAEHTQLKVIATDRLIDFSPLVVAPRTGRAFARGLSRTARGGNDALFDLLRDTLHGGSLTRGIDFTEVFTWEAFPVNFDVAPKQ